MGAKAKSRQETGVSIVSREATVKLRAAEAQLLAEAQRRGREALGAAENAMSNYGEWMFIALFQSDTKAVLDAGGADNVVWNAMLDASDSAKLPLGRTTLVNALRVAAYDKRLADGAWQRLVYSHKVALLPLADPKAMRGAARHVLKASLTTKQVVLYVGAMGNEGGTQLRLSPSGAKRALVTMAKRFDDSRSVSKYRTQLAKLDEEGKEEVATYIENLVETLQSLLSTVRKK